MDRFELALFLNQIAQGVRDEAEGLRMLLEADDKERFWMFIELTMMIREAHPTTDIVAEAIEESGLKPTFTPCVLLEKKPLSEALAKMHQLPRYEDKKSFPLLMTLFRLADRQRRLRCGDFCTHWWHQDLGDEAVVQEIIRNPW